MPPRLHRLLCVLTVACHLLLPAALSANPINVTGLYPGGVQRGKAVDLTVVGDDDLAWPLNVWTSHPGIRAKALEQKWRLEVTVSPATPWGVHWFRFYNENGASGLRPFLVGTLSETLEVEPNDEPSAAQSVTEPVTVNGRLGRVGDVDAFEVELEKGETLVASLQGHRHLLSPVDTILQLASEDGFVLLQNDDDQERDPRIVFTAPKSGAYVLRLFGLPLVPNQRIQFAGADAFVYRLTLTTGAFIDHVYPLALPRHQPGSVELWGWNIPAELKKFALLPSSSRERLLVQHAAIGNAFPLRLVSCPVLVENNASEAKNPFKFPASFTGRIDPPGDRDVYEFHAKKGDKLRFTVEARKVGSLIDAAVRIFDAGGKTIAELDDQGDGNERFDPRLDFSAPEDGEYRLEVRDLFEHGGERYVYCVHAVVPEPRCRLSLSVDRYVLTPGKELEIPVKVLREDGFQGDLEIALLGLPATVKTTSIRSTPKENTGEVKLKLNAEPPGLFSGNVRVVGQGIGPDARLHTATFEPGGWHAPNDLLWLTVLEAPKEEKKPEKKN